MPVLKSHIQMNSVRTQVTERDDTGTQGLPDTSDFKVSTDFERVKQLAKTGENFNTVKYDPIRPTHQQQNATAFAANRQKKNQ